MVEANLAFSARGFEISKLLMKHYSELPNERADRNELAGWHFLKKNS